MNKLQTLQKKIEGLAYCTYSHGTFCTWQERNKLLSRLELEGIPVEWLKSKRLSPSQIRLLEEAMKKHYPGVAW